uniref:Uncharacterized protein n=1 Tax=virus sp. ctE0n6 TaxID=2827985 RepID=A0A8S5RF69_9VIRU|nr:MAG TPA: hypothetical protein [virus sp. ctE0n6]
MCSLQSIILSPHHNNIIISDKKQVNRKKY